VKTFSLTAARAQFKTTIPIYTVYPWNLKTQGRLLVQW
jgi:hypothetical protein